MSGASIRIEVDDKEIAAGLKRLVEAGRDLGPAMAAIGAELLKTTQQRFESKTGPDGGAWSPFAKSTLKRMPKRRKPPELLRDRGRLYGSLSFLAEDAAVEVGTNVVYAGIHQFGGEIRQDEREGSATFIFARQGAGRTKDGKRVGSRLRFANAKNRAKSKHTRTFTVPERTFSIPARPYLGISEADKASILTILTSYLGQDGGAQVAP